MCFLSRMQEKEISSELVSTENVIIDIVSENLPAVKIFYELLLSERSFPNAKYCVKK